MLNMTQATAEATTAQTADAYAAQAATRPLAGFGAGAFTCDGAWVGSLAANSLAANSLAADCLAADCLAADCLAADCLVNESAAALALPRIKPACGAAKTVGASTDHAQARFGGAAYMTSRIEIVPVDAVPVDFHNFIQSTRLYLVTAGGVGPHPAREPVPV